MHPPSFWTTGGPPAALLSPASWLTIQAAAARARRPGWRAPVPVLCCGNATVGGAGKTTLALDLAARLRARGMAAHALSRGYGGSLRGVVRVDPGRHRAAETGDEPLLLAALLPSWIGADRAAAARAAIADGAGFLLLDDGLQSPGLVKDRALLVIDGATGFGNGRVLPAGPLREPVAAAAARCVAAVLIGQDATGALLQLPPGLPVLRAHLSPGPRARALSGRRVLAFAGIARPEKFFAMLRACGADLAATRRFADHHRFSRAELDRLFDDAARAGAVLTTTAKDAIRLAPPDRARVLVAEVALAWEDPDAPDRLLT